MGIQGRKAIVLFSDGVDASSHNATYESRVHTVEELDALIYPILYDTYDPKNDHGNAPRTSSGLPSIFRRIPLPLPIPTQSSGTGGSKQARCLRSQPALTTFPLPGFLI
jgi:hypothetical protein